MRKIGTAFILLFMTIGSSPSFGERLVSCSRYTSNNLTAPRKPLYLDKCVEDVPMSLCIREREEERKVFGYTTKAFRWDIAYHESCSEAAPVWNNPDY